MAIVASIAVGATSIKNFIVIFAAALGNIASFWHELAEGMNRQTQVIAKDSAGSFGIDAVDREGKIGRNY